ncbi:MAG: carbohydrate kinase [Gammaproteobacteria bacterium]|nr:carbohydrate kinase [Gammaproteobacteria bacterium]NNJ83547.1 carbohydrate kinase [Gammaproteobacteria bacterium]
MILGEVLFDRFPSGETVLGGAPFNVAWHLKGFGATPLFISRVGGDDPGREIRGAMRNWNMDRAGLQQDVHHPTGTVRVTLEGGQPTFDILPDQAYDYIDAMAADTALATVGKPGLLYHGTLIVRTAAMHGMLETLLTNSGLPVFVDVNLRAPWWNESDIKPILQRARWVKVNDDELTIIANLLGCRTDDPDKMARYIQTVCGIHLLIVTRGHRGAIALDETGRTLSVTPNDPNSEIVDTVGAGDAFSAVIIMGLLQDWPLSAMMQKAQTFASRVCRLRGAITTDPDFYRDGLAAQPDRDQK